MQATGRAIGVVELALTALVLDGTRRRGLGGIDRARERQQLVVILVVAVLILVFVVVEIVVVVEIFGLVVAFGQLFGPGDQGFEILKRLDLDLVEFLFERVVLELFLTVEIVLALKVLVLDEAGVRNLVGRGARGLGGGRGGGGLVRGRPGLLDLLGLVGHLVDHFWCRRAGLGGLAPERGVTPGLGQMKAFGE